MRKITLFFIVLLCLSSIVYAEPPFLVTESSSTTLGLQIEYPPITYLIQNQPKKFHFHIFNATTGYPITAVDNCTFHLYSTKGSHIFTANNSAFSDVYDIEIIVNESNFTTPGFYSYIFQCQRGIYGGFVSTTLEVTYDGFESSATRNIYIQLGLIALCFFILLFAYKLEDEHTILKIFLLVSSFTSIILVPLLSIIHERANRIAYNFVLGLLIVFWLYVIGYFIYWVLKKMNLIVGGSDDE